MSEDVATNLSERVAPQGSCLVTRGAIQALIGSRPWLIVNVVFLSAAVIMFLGLAIECISMKAFFQAAAVLVAAVFFGVLAVWLSRLCRSVSRFSRTLDSESFNDSAEAMRSLWSDWTDWAFLSILLIVIFSLWASV